MPCHCADRVCNGRCIPERHLRDSVFASADEAIGDRLTGGLCNDLHLRFSALLSIHPKAVIWGVYLGVSALLAVIGGTKIVRLCRVQKLRWFLPDGFWKYALSTQQVSLTSFFANRLDYILIVNFGGLRLLGKYVAVMAVGSIVKMVSGFFMDTLFPALTNTIATRNHIGARQLLTMHARILFLVVTATSCTIMVLAVPATAVLGPNYTLTCRPYRFGGAVLWYQRSQEESEATVLASIARQQFAVWVNVLNLGLFIGLFFILWPRWNLAGAVVADGVALTISYIALVARSPKERQIFSLQFDRLWLNAAAVQAMVGLVAWWCMPLGCRQYYSGLARSDDTFPMAGEIITGLNAENCYICFHPGSQGDPNGL